MQEETQTDNFFKKKAYAIGLSCIVCWAVTALCVFVLKEYAFGLFIGLPVLLGYMTTVLYGRYIEADTKTLRNLSFLSLVIFCLGLLFLAIEGVICMIMAAPLGLLFTWLGHFFGMRSIRGNTYNPNIPLVFLIVAVPAIMGFESITPSHGHIRAITTSIEINASPGTVWKNIVSFPPLKEPAELIFKTGIAYPTKATISGTGVGAIRNCNFSTGTFIEPITTWEENKLLAFDVLDQPEPMKELSFYDIHPNHLHGYWVSKKGQFKLTELKNGNTLVEGTTWYSNKIQPDFYWTIWSDFIVHIIHNRVLKHIKEISETQN